MTGRSDLASQVGMLVFISILLTAILLAIHIQESKTTIACEQKGGKIVTSNSKLICAKIEEVK